MSLADYHYEMSHCHRCSYCKFLPFPLQKSLRFSQGCPSILYRNFHSFCAGGRVILGLSIVEGRTREYTEFMKNIVFECTMCGASQVQCRTYNYNLNPIDVMHELRQHFVEQGEMVDEHYMMIEDLKREDNVFGEPKANRADWAKDLDIKDVNREKADVLFHVGCRTSYDEEFHFLAKIAINILKNAGVDVGISYNAESCCGARAYEIGHKGVFSQYADDMKARVKSSGATKLVTLCSDCYGAFNNYYPKNNKGLGVEVIHITQFLDNLLKEGKLKFQKSIPGKITYHDPCHLGRRGEKGVFWEGEYKRLKPHIFAPIPEKPMQLGLGGCYDAPRNILSAIDGIELVEMERNRIHSFCCGAGGGAVEGFYDFAIASALERIEEAKSTGADALVTACPWCERNFRDALEEVDDEDFRIMDILELAGEALGG